MKINKFLGLCISAIVILSGCSKEELDPSIAGEALYPVSNEKITGAESQLLKGEDAGLPLESLPGVKTISMEEFLNLDEIPETGLYLLDTDFVPQEMEENLKDFGYSLSEDGTLDSAGIKITLFVKAEMHSLKRDKEPNDYMGSSKASPLRWAAYSWSFWAKYYSGFCRKYKAHTRAYAYGPRSGKIWPRTNIEIIQTYVNRDLDVCYNCHQESSKWGWDIGCFWPAHGGASGYHYFYMYDSGTSVFKDRRWKH